MRPFRDESIIPRYMYPEELVYYIYRRQRNQFIAALTATAVWGLPGFLGCIFIIRFSNWIKFNSHEDISVELFNAYIGEEQRKAYERSVQKSKFLGLPK